MKSYLNSKVYMVPVFASLLAALVACQTATGDGAEAAWSLNVSGSASGQGPHCALTFSSRNDFISAFITIAKIGDSLALLVKRAGVVYPEGPDVVYKMVWTGVPGPLEINMRPIAHAFLLTPVNFQTDPVGRLPLLLQVPSTLSIASTTSAQVYVVKLPAVPRAMGLRHASCVDKD